MFSSLFLFFIQFNNPCLHLQMFILLSFVVDNRFHHSCVYCWCHWRHTRIHLVVRLHLSWWIVIHLRLGLANASSAITSSKVTALCSSWVNIRFEHTLFVGELRFYMAGTKTATQLTKWFRLISCHIRKGLVGGTPNTWVIH